MHATHRIVAHKAVLFFVILQYLIFSFKFNGNQSYE